MLLLLSLLPGLARPLREARAQGLDVRARYEEGLIGAAMLRHRLRPEPDPDGKLIERIVVDASTVILPGDFPLSRHIPWTLANYLHARTRDYIVRQELLFHEGEPYRRDLVEESGRNLRDLFILSTARLVAARGSAPDRVVMLVVTKDQWSLRLNTEFTLDQGRLDYLSFSFSEHNVAGRNKRASLNFGLNPGRYLVGLSYSDPRIWSSRHAAVATASLLLNRETSKLEGGQALLQVGRPLFSLRTRWGWQAQVSYSSGKYRLFRGGDLYYGCFSPEQGLRAAVRPCVGQQFAPPPRAQAVDAPGRLVDLVAPLEERIPFVYGYEYISGTLQGMRSWGVRNKVNLTAGLRVESKRNYLTEELAGISPAGREAFTQFFLPRSEGASGPFVSLNAYRAEYVRMRNIETFALTEDIRLGPSLFVEARYANPNFGFKSHFLELSGSFSHRMLLGDDLFYYGVSGAVRVQPGVCPRHICPQDTALVNEEVLALVRNVSPRFGPLRLHVSGRLRLRAHDLDRVQLTLGLDNGLRGFAPRAYAGNGQFVVNAELRTLALNLWTIHVGAVLFYDGGATPAADFAPVCPPYSHLWLTFPELRDPGRPPRSPAACDRRLFDQVTWHQDVGVGLRILIPQFNRSVLRLDLAFPFEYTAATYQPRFSAEFGQAF